MVTNAPLLPDRASQSELARNIEQLSIEKWGAQRPVILIGRHRRLSEALKRLARAAIAQGPVLITGETGTGKELFARAVHLLGPRRRHPFLSVNCGRYPEPHVITSELFGHKRGSFTGASTDHRGIFEEAEGGIVFLDEIGELSPAAQGMLLRTLSEGEIRSVGASHAKAVDVRVVAATNRDLAWMVAAGTFREDLYYRLRFFHVHIPPVRERGDDWELIVDYHLKRLAARATTLKHLSTEAITALRHHQWPGNVRELVSVVEAGFYLSDGAVIEYSDLAEQLEEVARGEQLQKVPAFREPTDLLSRMMAGGESFWTVVYHPFMARELSRGEARDVIEQGLYRTRGSYKRLLELFRVEQGDYLKFMDFLRHQHLKPQG